MERHVNLNVKTLLFMIFLLIGITTFGQNGAGDCNTKTPWIANTYPNLTASSNVSGGILCLSSVSNVGNVTDSNTDNYAQISLNLLGCSATIAVADAVETYQAGTYAGFNVEATSLLSLSAFPTVTIETYNDGVLQESQDVLSSSIGLNTSLINGSGRANLGFITTADFDEIRITYENILSLLFTTQVYYAVIENFCDGSALSCNVFSAVNNPDYPLIINSSRTGINGLACVSCSVDGAENVISADATDYASMILAVSVGNIASLSVQNVLDTYNAGTFAGFHISNPDLLSLDLPSVIQVNTYLEGTLQESSSASSLLTVGTTLLNGNGEQNVGFITTLPFDEVELEVKGLVGVSLGETRVYNLVVEDFCEGPALDCATKTYLTNPDYPVVIDGELSGIDGVACVACSVDNPEYIIDNDISNTCDIIIAAGVLSTGSVAVKNVLTSYPAGTFAGFDIESSALLELGLLNAVTITTYLDGVEQEMNSGTFLTLSLISSNRKVIGFVSTKPFDEVRFTVSGLVDVDLGITKLHGAVLKSVSAAGVKAPELTAEGTASPINNVCPSTTVNLNNMIVSSTPAGSSVVWYTNDLHTGSPYATPNLATAGIYFAYFYDESTDCYSNPSDTIFVEINICEADLKVEQTANVSEIRSGEYVDFVIVVSNLGPDSATGVTVSDLLPDGYTFVSSSVTNGVYDENTGVWNIGDLSSFGTDTLTLSVLVKTPTGTSNEFKNTAEVTGNEHDSDLSNNTSSVDINVWADIALNDDSFQLSVEGGTTGSVFDNDNLNNDPIIPQNVNVTIIDDGGLSGLLIDSLGHFNVLGGNALGNYPVQIKVCEKMNPTNCQSSTAIIQLIDTIPPCIGCDDGNPGTDDISCNTIGDPSVGPDSGVNTYVHNGTTWDVTATDNDAVASIAYTLSGVTTGSGTSLDGVTFNVGTTTVTWIVTDNSGNSSECSFDVFVYNTDAPYISCAELGGQTVATDTDLATYTHSGTAWDVTATDSDGIDTLYYTLSGATSGSGTSLDGVTFNLGTTIVSWTAKDNFGNTSECSIDVIVADEQAPCIGCDDGNPGTDDISCNTIGDPSVGPDSGVNTYVHNGTTWDVTATDNDAVASIAYTLSGVTTGSGTSLDGVTFNVGTTTVTWIVTDNSGNSSECSFDVFVYNTDAPYISCAELGGQTVATDTDLATYTHSGTAWDVTATDSDGIDTLYYTLSGATSGSGTSLDGVTFNLGTTIVSWTAKDNFGNTSECSIDVIVADEQAPCIGCDDGNPGTDDISCNTIGDPSVGPDSGVNTYVHNGTTWDVTATDNDAVASIAYTLSGVTTGSGTSLDGVTFNVGTTTVTWIVTDNSGNSSECSFDVFVYNTDAPYISCAELGGQTVATDTDLATYTHSGTAWDVTATDSDGIDTLYYTLSGATSGSGTSLDGVTFNLGTTIVSWTAKDNFGNTSECSIDVIVADEQAPCIGCDDGNPGTDDISCNTIGDPSVGPDSGINTYVHNGTTWDVTATDNDAVASIAYTLSGVTTGSGTSLDGVTFNVGTTTVTWIVTDNSGNSSECSFDVFVYNTDAPYISCAELGGQTVATDTDLATYTHSGTAWDVTATDSDGIDTLYYTLSGATSGSGTSLDGVTFNLGTTIVSWTAKDNFGNTSECSIDVIVADEQAPCIGCDDGNPGTDDISCNTIGDPSVGPDSGVNTYVHNGTTWDVTATDNDAVASIAYTLSGVTTGSGTSLDGVTFNVGTTTVTWIVTDNSGNSSECSFDVFVYNTDAPYISCAELGGQTVATDTDLATYTHSGTAWDVTATDSDGIDTLYYTLSGATSGSGTSLDGVTFNLGTTIVSWTAKDNFGNTSECSIDVIVADEQAPCIGCDDGNPGTDDISCNTIGDPSVGPDSGVNTYVHNGTTWDVTATDNDAVASIAYTLSGVTTGSGTSLDGVTFNVGTTTVTWTVTDNSGNSSECSFDVFVYNTDAPYISCAELGGQTVATDTDLATYTHSGTAWDVTATDSDGIDTLYYTLSGATSGSGTSLDGVTFNLGTTIVSWTAKDNFGNTSECSIDVIVADEQAPCIGCDDGNPGTDDISCNTIGDPSVGPDSGVNTYVHNGTTWDVTATDNDAVASITYTLSGITTGTGTSLDGVTFNQGTTTVTWTATDGSGNSLSCGFEVTVTALSADLSVTKTVDNPNPGIGETVIFTISVTNNGPGNSTGVIVADLLPAGYSYESYESTTGVYDPFTGLWEVGNMELAEVQVLKITCKITLSDDYINVATVSSDQEDDVAENNLARVSIDLNTELVIPEIFSPNGDNIQDYFKIKNIGQYPDARIYIYNRWGNLVYEKKGYGNVDRWGITDAWWNGFANQKSWGNKILPSATYFYLLYLRDNDSPKKGYVFLNK